MTLEEVIKEIMLCKEQLAKVPAIERRMHHLMGMKEVLDEKTGGENNEGEILEVD